MYLVVAGKQEVEETFWDVFLLNVQRGCLGLLWLGVVNHVIVS